MKTQFGLILISVLWLIQLHNNALSYLPYFEEYGNMFGVDPALLMAIAAWKASTHSDKGSSDGFGIMGLEEPGVH